MRSKPGGASRTRRADVLRAADRALLAAAEGQTGLAAALIRAAMRMRLKARNVSTPDITLKVHGRYCGPGHSGPGAPVDALDAACKAHDEAYATAPRNARGRVARKRR